MRLGATAMNALRRFDEAMRTDPERAVALLETPRIQAAFAALAAANGKRAVSLSKLDRFLEVQDGRVIVHCLKCDTAIEAQQLAECRFRYQFVKPARIMTWDVARARSLVAASGRQPVRFAPQQIEAWFVGRSNLTPGHMLHIPREHWEDPVLADVVMLQAYHRPDRRPVVLPSVTLIDGHHRAALSMREGFPLTGYLLTPAEHAQVVTSEEGAYDPELMGWRAQKEVEQIETVLVKTGKLPTYDGSVSDTNP
jgi:hypothetical protein